MSTTLDGGTAGSPPSLPVVPDAVARIIGVTGPRRETYYPVDRTAIGYFCEFSENADPRSDPRHSTAVTAPATFLLTAMRSPTWTPSGGFGEHQYVHVGLPLGTTRAVNTSVEHEFHRRLAEGDRVSFTNTIVTVTPRINRLGPGFLVTERVDSWDQDERAVGTTTVSTFMYGFAAHEPARAGR